MMLFRAKVNGRKVIWHIEPYEFLTEVLRRHGLIGTKRGCESGDCGACAVLLDGREVSSCILLAAQADGHEIVTIEGLADGERPHPVQEAFVDAGAIQCGFCTPGMIVATRALLDECPEPSEADARSALAGHLCRCTGYTKPIGAVLDAADRMRGPGRNGGEGHGR
jgi:aerobic-type carbon monoxide dehydrogenase small subunit (CoxS/CutS family)